MSIGRTSAFTQASIRILITALLVGLFPGVSADCWINDYGFEQCGLTTAEIVGIAVGGCFVLLIVILIVWACLRRRGPAQTTIVYPPHAPPGTYLPQTQPGTYYPQVQQGTGIVYGSPAQPQLTAQYPLQSQKGLSSQYGYDPSSGFTPSTGSPPQQAAIPVSP